MKRVENDSQEKGFLPLIQNYTHITQYFRHLVSSAVPKYSEIIGAKVSLGCSES